MPVRENAIVLGEPLDHNASVTLSEGGRERKKVGANISEFSSRGNSSRSLETHLAKFTCQGTPIFPKNVPTSTCIPLAVSHKLGTAHGKSLKAQQLLTLIHEAFQILMTLQIT